MALEHESLSRPAAETPDGFRFETIFGDNVGARTCSFVADDPHGSELDDVGLTFASFALGITTSMRRAMMALSHDPHSLQASCSRE